MTTLMDYFFWIKNLILPASFSKLDQLALRKEACLMHTDASEIDLRAPITRRLNHDSLLMQLFQARLIFFLLGIFMAQR